MKSILHRFRPLWLGALITLAATVLLANLGVVLIDPGEVGENVAIFTLWSLVIAFLIHRFEQAKDKPRLLMHIGTLLSLLAGILIAEKYLAIADNPLSIGFMVAIWIYLLSWAAPRFFGKYRSLIIGLYTLILLAFTYGRLFSEDYFAYKEPLIFAFLWPIPFFFALWIYEQWKWLRSLQHEKSAAELALLKSQINPHFFFNTLNNLHALTVNRAKEAPDVILKLSEMMRYTIYEGKKEMVPVSEEVAYLQHYIELHEIRQHQKVDITFADEVAEGVMVSPLLFIVLLENAFKHGAERLLSDAFIDLQLNATPNQIRFEIRNNFDPEEQPPTPGIGLANLRRRLNLVYPEQHQLDLSSNNNIYSAILTIDLTQR
ncbi:MAG: sensor histidine kinase [Lewinellaceae bacterium]|nr:sensor histidine kinase [Lewinellaceae bacterium]